MSISPGVTYKPPASTTSRARALAMLLATRATLPPPTATSMTALIPFFGSMQMTALDQEIELRILRIERRGRDDSQCDQTEQAAASNVP